MVGHAGERSNRLHENIRDFGLYMRELTSPIERLLKLREIELYGSYASLWLDS